MTKTIALCTNVPELDQGGLWSLEVCKKYPGSAWAAYLKHFGEYDGYRVMTGSEAVNAIEQRELKPSQVLVLQEEENPRGIWLTNLGAEPVLLFSFETPLFSPFFYDRLPELKKIFPRQMLFSGGTDPVYFPSFDLNELREPAPWDDRKNLCMVVSNKHYSQYAPLFRSSPSWQQAVKTQLHDFRYEAINYFRGRGMLDLYGKGWPPEVFAPEIPAGQKNDVIRHYKFALCFENGRQPGYVTEKIFDCLVAGVVPIYAGAPDIASFVTPGSFYDLGADLASEGSPAALFDSILAGFENRSAQGFGHRLLDAGQHLIRSPKGRRHSYQGFAENVLKIVGDS